MNLKMKYILFYLLAIIFSIFVIGCSELNTDIPPAPKVNIHGDSLYNPANANYHVNSIKNSPNGFFDCQECHAGDFSGGPSGAGCDDCHAGIGAHQTGYLDPSSSGFHGNFIRNNDWDMTGCQSCHGPEYKGKVAVPDYPIPGCRDCHSNPGGPENCTTCHGSATSSAPPKDLSGNTSTTIRGVGAHQSHLKGNVIGKNLSCTECHNYPGGVDTPGHIDSDLPAELLFNNTLANNITNDPSTIEYDATLPLFEPNPSYNTDSLTCSNTYCHGYFKNGNLNNKPVWTNASTSACGSCHGDGTSPLPKTISQGGTHPGFTDCSMCHDGVVDANQNIINPSKHIDGLLNLYGSDIKY